MGFTFGAAIALVAGMVAIGVVCARKGINKGAAKILFGMNLGVFFGLLAVTTFLLFSGSRSHAAEAGQAMLAGADIGAGAGAASASGAGAGADAGAFGVDSRGLAFLSAALSTGLATIGAGIGVAFTGSAALGAISEDQTILGKTLIFVGLAEGTAIYGLIVSILILGYV